MLNIKRAYTLNENRMRTYTPLIAYKILLIGVTYVRGYRTTSYRDIAFFSEHPYDFNFYIMPFSVL